MNPALLRRRRDEAGGTAFSPASLSGLALWWQGGSGMSEDSAGTTAADVANDPVGRWAGQSGTAAATQGTTASKPVVKLLGSRLVPWFDNVDDRLVLPSPVALGTSHTLFAVLNNPDLSESQMVLGDDAAWAFWFSGAALGYNDGGANRTVPHGGTNDATQIWELVRSGTAVEFFRDGTSLGSVTLASNAPFTARYLSGYTTAPGTTVLGGYLADLVGYTGALSAADRLPVRRYLANLNGIAL